MSLSDLARQTQFIDGVGQAELVASGKVSASNCLRQQSSVIPQSTHQ
ncbi:MAG: hypothetical protein ACKO80_03035 [Acidimicrobiaceae bacterium]